MTISKNIINVLLPTVQEVQLSRPRKENTGEVSDKLNVANVFNREEEVSPAHKNKNLDYNESAHRAQKYEQVLGASIVEL